MKLLYIQDNQIVGVMASIDKFEIIDPSATYINVNDQKIELKDTWFDRIIILDQIFEDKIMATSIRYDKDLKKLLYSTNITSYNFIT